MAADPVADTDRERRPAGRRPPEEPAGEAREAAGGAGRHALWNRDFGLFFGARTIAKFGDGMVPVALATGLVGAGEGTFAVSFALGAWTACFAGFVLFGGVLADRFSARRMMVLADLLRLVVTTALVFVFAAGQPVLWLVYVLSAVNGVGTGLFQPGIASTIPAVTTEVQRANAVVRVSESLMAMAGPAAAGVLAGLGGASALFAVNAATFGVSGVCLFLMRRAPAAHGDGRSMLRDLVDGWRGFRSRTWLWSVIAVWTAYSLVVLGPMLPLQAVLITRDHGASALGTMLAVQGAGNAAGGLLAMRLRPRKPLAAGALALLGLTANVAALALGAPLPLLGAAFFAGGAGLAFWVVMWSTAVQTHVPAHELNRVHAYDVAGSVAMLAAGRALATPAAHWLGARELLLGAAALNVGVVAVLLLVPAVRGLRRADG
ncbi:MFS transporter [Streptomyces sp. Ru87]|uniref:MFS transporter n=1 Tax=Streptomyces sp. Ru87 TaxID=2044307 RepID=UPI000BF49B7C|nr:MFS transporter [Streptomyces sp. Ru87]PGH52656.1 MFS transporter [Streptomyces sp. Ru87]